VSRKTAQAKADRRIHQISEKPDEHPAIDPRRSIAEAWEWVELDVDFPQSKVDPRLN
jgi:hypothetical protein